MGPRGPRAYGLRPRLWLLAQGSIQCRKCIGSPVVRTDGRTDVRTDGHVTTTSLPKFFGLIDYQISLAMELR